MEDFSRRNVFGAIACAPAALGARVRGISIEDCETVRARAIAAACAAAKAHPPRQDGQYSLTDAIACTNAIAEAYYTASHGMTPRYPWIARDYLEMKRTALTLDLRWFLRLRLWASQDQRFLEHQRLLGRSFEQDVEELTALHGHLYRQPENQKWTVALRQNNGAEMLELRSGCGVLRFPWGEWPDGWAEMDDPPGTIICQVEV